MGLWPTHRDEGHKRCRPRVSGDPCQVDSRFRPAAQSLRATGRGNDVAFDGGLLLAASSGIWNLEFELRLCRAVLSLAGW
jgi:hypothetical protein